MYTKFILISSYNIKKNACSGGNSVLWNLLNKVGNLLKLRISEIHVKQIRVIKGVGVRQKTIQKVKYWGFLLQKYILVLIKVCNLLWQIWPLVLRVLMVSNFLTSSTTSLASLSISFPILGSKNSKVSSAPESLES